MRAISKDLAELDARIERLRERIKTSDLDLTAFGRAAGGRGSTPRPSHCECGGIENRPIPAL